MKIKYTLVFILFPFYLQAQDSLFSYFTLSVTEHESVLLRWEVESGSTCNGIEIQRSTDSINYSVIHFISGICGNSSAPVPYQYEDFAPVSNTYNYYRLVPGAGEPTRPQKIFFIDLPAEGYLLYPNPATDKIKIYFRNNDSDPAVFNLINPAGATILTETTNSDNLELNISSLSPGACFFTIEINQQITKGYFVKN